MKKQKIFRFDDVSLNTNKEKLKKMISLILDKHEDAKIILGISPFVHDMGGFEGKKQERIFPEILNAYSDFRVFYNIDKAGIPLDLIKELMDSYDNVCLAGHGLVHADHRLMSKEAQEMSILVSCNLVKAKIFIPPFNKYNKDTELICLENNIELLKFEDGWTHLVYHKVEKNNNVYKYYVHTHDFDLNIFEERI